MKPTLIQTWKSVRLLKIFALAPRHISLKSWLTRQFSFSSDTPLRKSTLVPFFLSDILSEEKVFAKRKGLELFSDRELYNNKRKSIESQWCQHIGKLALLKNIKSHWCQEILKLILLKLRDISFPNCSLVIQYSFEFTRFVRASPCPNQDFLLLNKQKLQSYKKKLTNIYAPDKQKTHTHKQSNQPKTNKLNASLFTLYDNTFLKLWWMGGSSIHCESGISFLSSLRKYILNFFCAPIYSVFRPWLFLCQTLTAIPTPRIRYSHNSFISQSLWWNKTKTNLLSKSFM